MGVNSMNNYNDVDMISEINNVIDDINSNWQSLDINDVEEKDIWRDPISRSYISKLREIDELIKSNKTRKSPKKTAVKKAKKTTKK